MMSDHICVRYRHVRREGPWRPFGQLRERDIERVSVCQECEHERAARYRKVLEMEREADPAREQLAPDPALRRVAERLCSGLRRSKSLKARPLLARLGGVRFEAELERLACHVPLRLKYRLEGGAWHLSSLACTDPAALSEFAAPGLRALVGDALDKARKAVTGVRHEEARAIADLLSGEEAPAFDEHLIRALARVALLVESGESLPSRVFSTEALGDSKKLASLRPRLEKLVGPLERLGIRENGALVLLGGTGRLTMPAGVLDVGRFQLLGLASPDVLQMTHLEVPSAGLLVVENLTPFYAGVERAKARGDMLVLWSGGFPARAALHLIRLAASHGARIRQWCDLDLGGVRIARLIDGAANGRSEPLLMGEAALRSAEIAIPLNRRQQSAIQADLLRHPDALLATTLEMLLERGIWMEQEGLLAQLSRALSE